MANEAVRRRRRLWRRMKSFHNVFDQTQRVIELVARGKAPEVTAADAFETMKLCFAAEESENTGKIVFNQ